LANKEKNYPILRGLISAPTLRHDGSLLRAPGFDERTGLYLNTKGIDFGDIPENPTKDDALKALEVLFTPFAEFPFVEGTASRSVFLAHLLTSMCRPSLESAPMFAYSAPTMRTGKGKLVNITSVVAHGHKARVVGASSNPEELDKQLSALIRSGISVIAIDNQDPDIPLASCLLSQMLTEADVRVRAFGDNKNMPKYPSTATISCTGNNLLIAKDLVERTVLCSLDAKTETPGNRTFKLGVDPVVWAANHRVEMVKACLTILRAYALAGSPPQDIRPMGGFESWDARVRSPLIWLGLDDPCDTMNKIRKRDPTSGTLATVLELWWNCFHESPQTAGAAVKKAKQLAEEAKRGPDGNITYDTEFYDALWGVAEKGARNLSMAVGRWLKSKDLVVLKGKRFVCEIKDHQSTFRVEDHLQGTS
jgi:putative DNA primase/helicase